MKMLPPPSPLPAPLIMQGLQNVLADARSTPANDLPHLLMWCGFN